MNNRLHTWTRDELNKVGSAEELRIATLRVDDTLRNRVIIWVVRVGDDIYVRCVNGREGAWFRGVLTQHEGRIWAGGVEKDVTFVEEPDPDINDELDGVYRSKYHRYGSNIVNSIISTTARTATIKLVPRPTSS